MLAAGPIAAPRPVSAQSLEQLQGLSIEQLGEIRVTSVSKAPEPVSDAPASVFVITHDDAIRSGAQTIPELLRLAPNLEVVRTSSNEWEITARGFNVRNNAFLSNKLLVLIDGRSVYSPMFGGVYWDMINVLPENIERIEVISGPGSTLWGSNAVNGVINIITRPSADTQGGLLTLGAGNLDKFATLQYGGRISPDLTYRIDTAYSGYSALTQENGKNNGDSWSLPQGGFRIDWTPANDAVTVQGDAFGAAEHPDGWVHGYDLSAGWTHRFRDGSSFQLHSYFDEAARSVNNGAGFDIRTYDIEFQHNFRLNDWNEIVWGAGERAFRYVFENNGLALEPPRQTLNLANIYVQDTISLSNSLKLTAGVKLENEPYAGWQVMPQLRLAWKASNSTLFWGAISRAVRSPTPVDVNFRELAGPVVLLSGSPTFRPEALTAYELGTRVQISDRASFSVTGFYDVYDRLRSLDFGAPPSFFPLTFGNLVAATSFGIEAWGSYQVTNWWRLSAGITLLHEDVHFSSGAVLANEFVANDPPHQASLRSAVTVTEGVTWDVFVRQIGALRYPPVPGYTELDTSVGWEVTKSLRLSLSGFNLLHPHHLEFITDNLATNVPRSVLAQATIRF